MYKGLVLIFLTILSSCSTEKGGYIEIFNAACETCSSFSVEGKGMIKDGVLLIENPSDTVGSATLSISGNWDLSVFNQLQIELVNSNKAENVNAVITIEDSTDSSSQGRLISERLLYYDRSATWIVDVPPIVPYPEISKFFTGMRATPYSINGVTSTLTSNEVKKISISFDKTVGGITLGIRRITASKVAKKELPGWTQLQKDTLFPLIDQYGQFIHKDWPGKTKSDSDLMAAREREHFELQKFSGDSNWCSYGGYKVGEMQPATGSFYVKKVSGKWWIVDPHGHLFWSHGVVRVVPSSAVTPLDDRKYLFSGLPDAGSSFTEFYKTQDERMYPYYVASGIKETYDFSASNLKRKYGETWRKQFADLAHQRLKSWGINTISAASDKSICLMNRTPYCDRLEPVSPRIDGVPKGLMAMRDPFHPDFTESLKQILQERKEELNTAWSFGYWIDNKISWGNETDMANWVLESSASQPAKIAFRDFLKKKYNTINELNNAWGRNYGDWDQFLSDHSKAPQKAAPDLSYFTNAIVEKYFSEIRNILKHAAPGKLYLGCRFNTMNERVLKIAAKYADVLSFDLFVDSLSDFRLPAEIDKPVMIGEFHFGALDRGMLSPGLNKRENQEQRGNAYLTYVNSALKNPFIVGTSWHQFSDQSTVGRFDGENFQDGLTDVCDRVYEATVEKVREAGYQLYQMRLK